MHKLSALVFILVGLSCVHAATPLTDAQMSGSANQVKSGATLTVLSGGTLTIASGGTFSGAGTFDFSLGTLTLANNQIAWVKVNKSGSSLADFATRSASDLSSGTLPDARFPSTLPALSGVNLTNLNASNLASGTVPGARMPAFSGDVSTSAGGTTTIVSNLPDGVTAAGKIVATNIAAPATPASGHTSVYVDSTSKNIAVKNDAGTVNHGVQTFSGTSHHFVSAIADDGSVTHAQPSTSDVSGLGTSATHAATDFASSGAITASGLSMSTARLVGRTTASTGAPEEITVGSGLTLSGGTLSASGGGGSLEVKEADGTPDVTGVSTIIVSNGTLTDNTGGSVTITTGGGGGTIATTTTSTGTQNDFSFSSANVLYCNNATLLTLTGLAAGTDGQSLFVVSKGAGQVDFKNQDTGSSAANRIINPVTGTVSLAPGTGSAVLVYDNSASRWRLAQHRQGALISVSYSSGNFTATSGSWTVDSGDQTSFGYYLNGSVLQVWFVLDGTSVSATPVALKIAIPGGFTSARNLYGPVAISNNGTFSTGICQVVSDGFIYLYRDIAGTGWSTATDNTYIRGSFTFDVQ